MQPTLQNDSIASSCNSEPARARIAGVRLRQRVVALATAGCILMDVWCGRGQSVNTNGAGLTNRASELAVSPASSQGPAQTTNRPLNAVAQAAQSERIRTVCINGRRRICGRVLQLVPGGLVVDSGYAGLLRPELGRSWVVPANVAVTRPPNLVEANTPGSICVGIVFITDIPQKPKVKVDDYVVIQAFAAGQYNYNKLGNLKQTIRKYSAILENAVELNLQAEAGKQMAPPAAGLNGPHPI
ncbi:MAG: hypothetical protein JWR26_4240 [Pedosphaera sp.]|nr:hypothetical protein [Pedosphaera sp.]